MFTDRDAVLFYAEHFSSAFPTVATLFRALYHDVDELAGDVTGALGFYEAWLDAPPDGSGLVCALGSHAEDGEPVFYICPPTESVEQLSKTEFLIRLSERCPHLFGALFAAAQRLYREGRFEPALIALRKQIERQDHFLLDQALVVLENAILDRLGLRHRSGPSDRNIFYAIRRSWFSRMQRLAALYSRR
jgi:hypothetical protein